MSSPAYRSDIDGLRAVAIIPVLLFHAGVPGFSGGFVGVDVFFVISGFLITGIIAREVDDSRFSIVRFYERRARRIMPALLAMIATVLVAGCALSLPRDLSQIAGSAIAATLFASNFWFILHTGYFAGGAETMPLLHSWSLAVEEQYYIAFPLLMLLIARFAPGRRTAILIGVTVLSFVLAWVLQARGDGIAFYMSPPRAWELLAGSLLATGAIPVLRMQASREAAAAAGLFAIGLAVLTYDHTTVFPGTTALLPVLGTAAVIHGGTQTFVARLLSLRPLVAIGMISYSLYLWHWPLIVFSTYATDAPLTLWGRIVVIAGSVGLAVLSWRYIERPFRDSRRVSRAAIFRATGTGMALVCAAAGALIVAKGWPARFPPHVVALAEASQDFSPLRKTCHDSDPTKPCTIGNRRPTDAALWGDSHGVELAFAIAERRGGGLIQQTHSSCPPALGFAAPGRPACAATNATIIAEIEANPRIRTVYLAGFWAGYAKAPPAVWTGLDATIARLTSGGRRVVLFGPIPSNPFDVPRRLAHAAQRGEPLANVTGELRDRRDIETAAVRTLAAKWQARGVVYVDPADSLCDSVQCRVAIDGRAAYFDTHHLSVTGARRVVAGLPPAAL